jgi:hypothetical protein
VSAASAAGPSPRWPACSCSSRPRSPPAPSASPRDRLLAANVHPPADAAPAKDADTCTGTYENDYYGRAQVVAGKDDTLTLRLGPEPQSYRLTHHDGDTFGFRTAGENAVGRTGVTFDSGENALTFEYLDTEGLGTFESTTQRGQGNPWEGNAHLRVTVTS